MKDIHTDRKSQRNEKSAKCNVEIATELFSMLSPTGQQAVLDLVKTLVLQNKEVK